MFRVYWRYGEEMCFIEYRVSDDRPSIVELSGGVETLRPVSAYHEPTWYFAVKVVNGQVHEMANVQKATGHGHDLASIKLNDSYIVYKKI